MTFLSLSELVTPERLLTASSIFVALLALFVGFFQARATRIHNRRSVEPVLQFDNRFRRGDKSGLRLVNVGLGPARIISAKMWVRPVNHTSDDLSEDGDPKEADWGQPVDFGEASINKLRDDLRELGQERPSAVTFGPGYVLASDYDEFLLSVPSFDKTKDAALARLVNNRLRLVLVYESLYKVSTSAEWAGG